MSVPNYDRFQLDDRTLAVVRNTLLLFVLVAVGVGAVRSTTVTPTGVPSVSTANPNPSQGAVPFPGEEAATRLWARDNRVSSVTSAPPASAELPPIEGARYVWHQTSVGRESWGLVTPLSGAEVGLGALEYYSERAGWNLAYSDATDVGGKGWIGVLTKPKETSAVVILAIPTSLWFSGRQETRVSELRVDKQGAEQIARLFVKKKAD